MDHMTRRGFMSRIGMAGGMLALTLAGETHAEPKGPKRKKGVRGKEAEVSPAEDLMREHGILRRVLLIYGEWVGRLKADRVDSLETLSQSHVIIRSFVEDYHEKLEEDYLFPKFRKAGRLTDLVETLLRQHKEGRALTDASLSLTNGEALKSPENVRRLTASLSGFLRMYEPHAAREDTVLFPAFHSMTPEKEYDRLGDAFERKENELFGHEGFETMVEKVASIERKLGIYDLARYTPTVKEH
jgi:hemerythrin-like domain-containing protein